MQSPVLSPPRAHEPYDLLEELIDGGELRVREPRLSPTHPKVATRLVRDREARPEPVSEVPLSNPKHGGYDVSHQLNVLAVLRLVAQTHVVGDVVDVLGPPSRIPAIDFDKQVDRDQTSDVVMQPVGRSAQLPRNPGGGHRPQDLNGVQDFLSGP